MNDTNEPDQEAMERERRRESGVFPKRPLRIVRAEGSTLYDDTGRGYLDVGASYGTNHVGHRHPNVVAAIHAQTDRLLHVPSTYHNDVRTAFLERLVGLAPDGLERAFLSCTGTEAMECAIKFARQATGRTGIISLGRAFHGRTFGALSATAKAPYRKPFEPLVPGFERVAAEDVEALKAAITPDTAAFLYEPIQGEGGVIPLSAEYLRTARDLCTDRGALLVADEVQTGLGRTGRFLASEHAGVTPDLVALGKGIGGGVPLAATLMTDEVAARQAPASHGNTFGGNPLAAAAGLAVLDTIVGEGLMARAASAGERLLEAWRPLADAVHVREVRGHGMMIGIELTGKPFATLDALAADGILALPAGATVVRFLPTLVMSAAERAHLADTVARTVAAPFEVAA